MTLGFSRNLGIRFEPVLGGLFLLKAMPLCSSMPSNVFGYEDKQFYPIYVSKQNNNDVLNLLLITEGEEKQYVLIKDINSLMSNKTKHRERKHFCMHCLQCFSTEEVLS